MNKLREEIDKEFNIVTGNVFNNIFLNYPSLWNCLSMNEFYQNKIYQRDYKY